MNLQSHILLKSGKLKPFVKDLNKVFGDTISLIEKKLPIKNVDIVIYDNPAGTIPEFGIGGYTPNAHLIFISIDPLFPNLDTRINTQLKGTLAHELHHTLRWRDPGYGETLLDALITEGLADRFDLEMFGGVPQPWSIALSDKEYKQMMKKAEKELFKKNYDHPSWFFGNGKVGIPRWTGYSLGYKIVGDYLKLNPQKKPSNLYSAKTSEFISVFT